ncbi:glycosyltransferase family 4 protein [Shewanella decolorationis]|uniref:Glycosyl group 1 family protein n=1 Tax=Shewanella decolorationis S12 TaxID=1353536 RepID=A0ABN0PME2_9GAMM|nr:glycosyltransferase family 4 protein [Shewanella decolorationis]ESE41254.1 glycosyl group 1 family protein [Shewanella decolorationis S12]GLR31673.1 glycosyl transferase [Shewanella decolorationis]
MKILIVNTSDIQGGAARAAYRLHKALLAEGVDSQMLVQSKSSDDFTVHRPETKFQKAMGKIRPTLDSLPVLRYKDRTKTLFSPSWVPFSGLVEKINALNPDVVHLHWIAGGMVRTEDLAKINAPIVWSLHDNWAFTGGCHIMWDCTRYIQSCGECPRLASKQEQDLSRKVWQRKNKTFRKIPSLKIIGLSSWLTDCARKSSLFKDTEVICLPNPINTKSYSPFEQSYARTLLNLPLGKKIIAFGAMSATSDINKGFQYLSNALELLSTDYELVVFGSSEPKKSQGFKQKAHYLGHLHDDISLRVLYSAADVMVVPSLQENLSNAIMESLACGTPVVGFAIGGNEDLIEHQKTGYLAKPFDIEDLAHGINWILNHDNPSVLAIAAREKVIVEFDSKVVAMKYIELYQTM